jgi:hypothetical protein
MEAIHQIIEGKILNQVISLPKQVQDILVEIIIKPVEKQTKPAMTRSELSMLLRGSHTESLSGAVQSDKDISLEDLRAERRIKYECTD